MTTAKIDFGSIPVIDVARQLLGEESIERSNGVEKHFSRSRRPLRQRQKKSLVLAWQSNWWRCPQPGQISRLTAISPPQFRG